jgi:transcriptional regulator of acetoin/glycerol metabolism
VVTAEATSAGRLSRGVRVTPPPRLLRFHRRDLVNVLVLGGTAGQRASVAHAFHREGLLCNGPFLRLDARREGEWLRLALQAWLSSADAPAADLLRAAERGTLFVDSVASLRPDAQRLLLAFIRTALNVPLETGESAWVGRLLAGDPEPLSDAVADGRFSSDLYDALDKVRVELPSAPGRGAARGSTGAGLPFAERTRPSCATRGTRTPRRARYGLPGKTGRGGPGEPRVTPW